MKAKTAITYTIEAHEDPQEDPARCDSAIVKHAERELAGMLASEDEMNRSMGQHILHMVKEFAKEGHSGFSASFAIPRIERLLKQEPLAPLTGEDDEWAEPYDDHGTQQNKRMSSVFRDANGQAYRIDGIVFRNQHGHTYTTRMSRVPVTFPFSPREPQVVDIYERDESNQED